MRKQSADNAAFLAMRRDATSRVPRAYIEEKADRAASDVRRFASGKDVWYAWSGGKDSIALGEVCRRAGVERCVFGMTRLEYPAFLAWVTDHMPDGIEVYQSGLDLAWLAANPRMLFPREAAVAARWFSLVQHKAQRHVVGRFGLDAIAVGRRREDGNFVGRGGRDWYESKGVVRYSPIADWTHLDVLALIGHLGLAMPPIYDWPNGFVVGTGPWAARQYTASVADGWAEVYEIDPDVVRSAAPHFASARAFLASPRPSVRSSAAAEAAHAP